MRRPEPADPTGPRDLPGPPGDLPGLHGDPAGSHGLSHRSDSWGADHSRRRGWGERTRDWLETRPLEAVGLSAVLATAVLVTGVVVWSAASRPTDLPPAAHVGDDAGLGWDLEEGRPAGDDHGGAQHPQGPVGDGGAQATDPGSAVTVTVHVSGAVLAPGVVTLPSGSRVADAVAAAGGIGADAELDRINLARLVVDAEQVHVPRSGEAGAGPPGGSGAGSGSADGRVDINRAGAAELEALPGIGPSRAAAIVAHRDEHGPFGAPGDLRAVSGIGEVTFQNLADLVVVR